ncbi:DUF4403 family protein [Paraburkholderia saeva]|nr:DUF4403 family protein [Paraburkholderia saeva]
MAVAMMSSPAFAAQITVQPPATASSSAIPPLAESTISVVANASLSQMCSQLGARIPKTLAENPSGHDCLQYGIYFRHDPADQVRCSGTENKIHVEATLYYQGGWRCGGPFGIGQVSCGFGSDPQKRAIVSFDSVLTWDPAWHLDGKPVIGARAVDACNATFINHDFSGFIQGKANDAIGKFSGQLPAYLSSATNFVQQATQAWVDLQKPIKLNQNPPVWLLVHPRNFAASNISINGDAISLGAQLQANPEVVVSATTPPSDNAPLPPLTTAPASNAFRVALNGWVTWAATNKVMADFISKEHPSYKRTFLGFPLATVTLEKVTVFGAGNDVYLAAGVDGSVRGTIYLHGVPQFNPTTQEIEIKNVDYTANTSKALEAADWFLHSALKSDLQSRAHYKIDHSLEDAQTQLQKALNQSVGAHVTLSGRVAPISGIAVSAQTDGLLARAVLNGTVNAAIH